MTASRPAAPPAPREHPAAPPHARTAAAPRRGQGRAALTAAAREVFAERGYHGTSIREIAGRAGLSLSALYHWHAGKEDLLAEVLMDARSDYVAACEQALVLAPADDPAERLRTMVAVTVDYRVRRRVESALSAQEWRNLGPAHAAALDELRLAATRLWSDIVNDGVRRGVFRCAAPDDARRSVAASCNAISQWYDPAGPLGVEELTDRYVAIALRIVDHRVDEPGKDV